MKTPSSRRKRAPEKSDAAALLSLLRSCGQKAWTESFADGTRLIILRNGGRVLGLFPSAGGANFLWNHEALSAVGSAKKLFLERWPNPGGDRTWLAPVPELFISDMQRLWETYREPAAIDPGEYHAVDCGGGKQLVVRARLPLFRSGGFVSLAIAKSFGPAADPLRYRRPGTDLPAYAGYTCDVSLRLLGKSAPSAPIGLWQLLQLPPGGELLLPTYGKADIRAVFGAVPKSRFKVRDGLVRYASGHETTFKFAVASDSCTGRYGYARVLANGLAELVVRNFSNNPSGEYVDPPFDDLSDLGYSFQLANVAEATIGSFSELEHHVPAIGRDFATRTSRDISQVWAYRGTRSQIEEASRLLLGHRPSFPQP